MHLVGFFPLFHRGEVSWVLRFKGFPKSLSSMIFSGPFVTNKNMKMVDQHGWILEFRAETDTK